MYCKLPVFLHRQLNAFIKREQAFAKMICFMKMIAESFKFAYRVAKCKKRHSIG
jgi:hypothetical protein